VAAETVEKVAARSTATRNRTENRLPNLVVEFMLGILLEEYK
jgi:hypothetical protein